MPSLDWRGLLLPFAYIVVLGGTFITFSSVYRRRKASQKANLEPWFPPHLQKDIYLTLLHQEPAAPAPGGGGHHHHEKAPRIPDSVLRAALVRRAVEDIQRIVQIRSAKQACTTLLQKGSVGDDLFQRFTRAEGEMEAELRDVVMEANGLCANWGNHIFQTANEVHANTTFIDRIDEIQAKTDAEREWWEKRRAAISSEFMKELEDDKKTPSDDGVLVDAANNTPGGSRPQSSAGGKKKKGKK